MTKRSLVLLTATAVCLVACTANSVVSLHPPEPPSAIVAKVVDGDTIDVMFANGSTDRVRLLGIDTPETFQTFSWNDPLDYGGITNTECLDRWGQLATQRTTEMLLGQTITLEMDPIAGERGFFGRLLAYVVVGGEDFNARLVREGYARVYTEGDSSLLGEYLNLQAQAQAEGLGLWQCGRSAMSLPMVF
jgi:micrococcal nuclease